MSNFMVQDGSRRIPLKESPYMLGLAAMPAPGADYWRKAYVYTGDTDPLFITGRVYYCKRTGAGTEGDPYVYEWAEAETIIVNALTSTDALKALAAPQGKALKDAADLLAARVIEKTGYGIHSGLAVTAQSTPDMTVAISGGVRYKADGTRQVVASVVAQAIDAADSVKNRKDTLYVNADGLSTYLAGGIEIDAVAGTRNYTITVNAVEDDTIGLGGQTLRAIRTTPGTDEFNIGATIALTATALYTALGLNAALAALYDVTNPSDGVVVLMEKTPGGGNTPGEAAVTGDVLISNGEPTVSAAAVKGKRDIVITDRAEENDTLGLMSQTFTCINGTPGTDEFEEAGTIAQTAINLAAAIAANATIGALYNVTLPTPGTIRIEEKTAGGGNTPGEATPSGTLAVTNGDPTTSAAAAAGARTYTITQQAGHKDTITIDGEAITALKAAAGTDEFVPGVDAAATALLIIDLINANAVLSAIFTATSGGSGIITVTEDSAGGLNTPGATLATGTVEITDGEATESVAHVAGDEAPPAPAGGIKIAEINVDAGTAAIESGMITKTRVWTVPGVND